MKLIDNQTVASLRKSGFKVKVHHERYNIDGVLLPRFQFSQYGCKRISPLGGKTTVYVTTPEGKDYLGISICSKKDSFNRKFGLMKALWRLSEVKDN